MNGKSHKKHQIVLTKDKLNNLKAIRFYNLETPTHLQDQSDQQQPPRRLSRRRSTLTGIALIPKLEAEDDISPEKLVKFNESVLLTTFISIHLPNDKLLYISEVFSNDMNPQFEVNLPYIPPNIHKFVLKMWCKTEEDNWKLLCVYKLNLWKLAYVEDYENLELFKNNTLALQLNDKWFSFLDMFTKKIPECAHDVVSPPIPSYTFDIIRQLNYFSNSLQELAISKHNLMSQIRANISNQEDNKSISNLSVILNTLQFKVDTLSRDVSKVKTTNEELINKIYNKKQTLKELNLKMDNFTNNTKELIESKLELYDSEIQSVQQSQTILQPQLNRVLKNYISIIQSAFPITNIDSTNFSLLGFQFPQDNQDILAICYYNNPDIELKNSYYEPVFDNESQFHIFKVKQINATLSLIVQLMLIIAEITNTKLKYKMILSGNESFILDEISDDYPISKKIPIRHGEPFKFPLFYDARHNEKIFNGSQYVVMNQNFEYGLKLINKNLMILIDNVQNLIIGTENIVSDVPLDCLDNFLWNLKYLELFMTA
ncbi:hypothetical protein SBY92_004030 [Candida maltosa Xu316]|uniref:Uncharacterized protein n=1 Tax=Candida maltosa (strain Xu316) TaxID=1245528 RepID=M3HMR9_CANMX|nr:hypothetical protein G210_0648 [Candida maltosa Xu316]